ncbi:sensor domain-containing protein [Streptomyces sp. NPDC059534]|uniref:sensor domain-containing protein n=1 Tax=Streptomyces sp. NPDC059534 TaxID=3346859 RepID=UPI0036A7427A
MRSAAVAATAVSVALLATACGGGKSDGKEAGKTAAPSAAASTAAAPPARALSAAELDKLIVGTADLKGYQVQKAEDIVTADQVTADKAACAPIAHAMSSVSPGSPAASAQRQVLAEPKKGASTAPEDALLGALGVQMTAVTLGSYDGQGAQDAFASVKAAGTGCAGGFTVVQGAEKTRIDKVAPESVTAGDEAVAFTVTTDMEGEPFVSKLVVFRQGNALASFSTISFAPGGVKELPTPVVTAQAAKLG